MIDAINNANDFLNNILFGVPMIIFILGTGLYLTIRLGFIQITKIKDIWNNTIKKMFKKSKGKGLISSGEAALISLGEIVGSGNIAGVATAIAAGGPGAIFWMWVAAFFGMATKFAEITLGIVYRKVFTKDGNVKGGPMYYLRDGVRSKFLAGFYAVMSILSYIVIVAMVDTNTIVSTVTTKFNIPDYVLGIALVIIVGVIIFGGIKRLGKFSKNFVPIMGIFYIISGLVVIFSNLELVGPAFSTIIKAAFTPQAAAGGFAGASIAQIIRYGFARGIYSNESGLGTAAFAHSAAETDHPTRQALWGPTEIFIDTIIVNTITGLVVVMSGLWTSGADGSPLVMAAFDKVLPGGVGSIMIFIASICFSFTCLTSASYVCQESAEYLFGTKSQKVINALWLVFIFIGSVTSLEFVWNLADTVNGLLLIPNLLGLLILSNVVVKKKKEFFKETRKRKISDLSTEALLIDLLTKNDISMEETKSDTALVVALGDTEEVDENGSVLDGKYTDANGSTYTYESILSIPSLGIEYPVLSDTSDELLKISINKFWGGSPNSVGNYCIVGHNYKSGKMFGKLSQMKSGDIIKLTDLSGNTLQYKVYDRYVVYPEDVACTSQITNGLKEVTLITCTNGGKQRLIIKCREV